MRYIQWNKRGVSREGYNDTGGGVGRSCTVLRDSGTDKLVELTL